MARRALAIGPAPALGWAAAALVALLTLGTLLAVALSAGAPTRLTAADWAAVRFTLLQATLSALFSVALAIPVARGRQPPAPTIRSLRSVFGMFGPTPTGRARVFPPRSNGC